MKYNLWLFLLIACSGCGSSHKASDPLATFELNKDYEFLSGLGKDRIIMILNRTDENKLHYQIELMRDYYGLPLDNGSVSLTQIGSDSSFVFDGGNEECKIKLRMFQSKEPKGGKRIEIERTCNDSTKNIASTDFQPLWRRGEAH